MTCSDPSYLSDRYGEIFFCPDWMTPQFCAKMDAALERIEVDAEPDEITMILSWQLNIGLDLAEACQQAREILTMGASWRLPGSWRAAHQCTSPPPHPTPETHMGYPNTDTTPVVGSIELVNADYRLVTVAHVVVDGSPYTVVSDEERVSTEPDTWRSSGYGVNDTEDRLIDHIDHPGEGESWADAIRAELAQMTDDDDDSNSETERFMGMAFGNRGLADFSGLDVDGPEPCGQHCQDCPRCGY